MHAMFALSRRKMKIKKKRIDGERKLLYVYKGERMMIAYLTSRIFFSNKTNC